MQAVFIAARGKANSPDNDPSRAGSAGVAAGTAGIVVKAAMGRLFNAAAFNKGATAYTLMVFDKAGAPANGDAPLLRKHLAANGDATFGPDELGLFGLICASGIGLAISSTPDTLTLAVAADLHWHALYK